MPDFIKDGTGQGYLAKVDDENRLRTHAVTETHSFHACVSEMNAYSMVISVTPTGAGDCFAYLKNDSTANMSVMSIRLYAAADENVQIKLEDSGTATGGTPYVPVNRNTTTSALAIATCEYGVDITGLSGGKVVDSIFIDGGTTIPAIRWESSLVVSPGHMISFYAVAGSIALKMTLGFVFHA